MTAAAIFSSIEGMGARVWRQASCALCAAAVLTSASASAQEPQRAAAIREAREQKLKELQPETPGRIERWLYQFEDRYLATRLFNPRQGLFVTTGGMPQGAGFSAGPAYRITMRPLVVTASAVHSIRGYWQGDINGRVTVLPGWKGAITAGVRRRHLPHEDFFGLGPGSIEENRTAYRIDDTISYLTAGVSPRDWLSLELRGEHRSVTPGRGEDSRVPSVHDVFSASAVPGLLDKADFVAGGARMVFDFTDRSLGPPAGGEYVLDWERASEVSGSRFTFDRWTADVRQYLPIVAGARTIALRVLVRGVRPAGGRDAPFYYYPALGGSNTLRGLPSYRLRDRHAVLGQIEYRFEMNEFLTGVVFYDAGRVSRHWSDLFEGRFEQDGGFGLRFGFSTRVVLRTEIAFGSRGPKLLVRFSDVF